MLSKKVCKRCVQIDPDTPWEKDDDEKWKNGYVYCPPEYLPEDIVRGGVMVEDGPTEECPYALEHVLATQRNKKC
jgi:hypothetical protein